jgi:hypothetical protein
VVFRLCFGQSGAPEDELVKMLLDIVFTKDKEKTERAELDGTRELTPLEDEDETPIIRSFLLQLLLEHTTESMKRDVMTYYSRCKQVLPGSMKVDQELSLLFTWCFEVISNC